MKRREFVKTTVAGAATAALATSQAAEAPAKPGAMPLRPFGKDGVKLSVIGFPGLMLARVSQEEANRLVAEAFERGVNYFDVAPAYGDAEVKMGPPLEPLRKKIFLACKTKMRDREGAKREFERSLERLRTDRFDLYQIHHLGNTKDSVDAAFAKGGAMEYILEQQKAGRIRYIGFSAHTEESALAALERFAFDSVMFPISFASWFKAGFGPKVVAAAKKRGSMVISIKGFCRERWPRRHPLRSKYKFWYLPTHERDEADLALRWVLSLGCTAAIPPGNVDIHKLALDIAPGITKPISEAETEKLQKLAQTLNPLFPLG